MARLMIYELPGRPGFSPVSAETRTLRHWLMLDDGRIFYQDETLRWNGVDEWLAVRSAWQELPTPPSAARIVGLSDYGGEPVAVRSDGEWFMIERAINAELGGVDRWVPMPEPVPTGEVR